MDRFRRITRRVREHRLVSSKSSEHLDTVDGSKYEQSPVTSKEFQSPAFPSEGFAMNHKRSRSRQHLPWDVHTTEGEGSTKDEDRKKEESSLPTLEKVGKSSTFSKVVEAATLETTAPPSQQEQAPSPLCFRPKARPVSMIIDNYSSSAGGVIQKVDENRSLESLIDRKPRKRLAPTDVPVILPKVKNKKRSTVDKHRKVETVRNDEDYSLNSFTASSTVDTSDDPLLGIESVFDKENSGASGEGADPQLQHVTQAPPLLDKKPSPQSPTQGSFLLQSPLTNGHDMSDGGERLHHITQNRPKGPARRPPSAIFKGNMRHSSGDSESSSLSIESPPKSNNLTGNPKLDFPSTARLSPPQPPLTAKPVPSSTHTPLPSSPAPAANKEIDEALSNIVLRANSGRAGVAAPSSMMPTSENQPTAPSRSPMARPASTFMGGANQSTVPWLQELNAKQKRKSHILEPEGKDGDPPAPPVSAKPAVSSSVKPPSKLQSSSQPQSDPPSAKQATKNIFTPKQFGGSQQQKPSASSFSSTTTAPHPLDAVDSSKAPQQQQLATPASRAPKHTTPQSSSTASIQPDGELRRPSGHSQPPSVTIVQPDVQDRRTSSISSQHSSTAGSYLPDVQLLRKPIADIDVMSSSSSSRKSSATSTSASSVSSSTVVATAVSATKLDGTASEESFAAPSRTASFAGNGEPARLSSPISAAAMVRTAHESGSVSSVTGPQVSLSQAPVPSPQPSVVASESLAAPVGTSSTTTVLSPSPFIPITAQGTNTSSTFVSHPTPSSHPPKKHSNPDKAGSVLSSDSVVPKDINEDAKALDNANAILNKLLPKVSALENRLEDQKREHTRQLNLLMSELDDERKKRACLEIEMERLKKMVLAYTTQV